MSDQVELKASQEAPCFLCSLPSAWQGKCLYHRMRDVPGEVKGLLFDLEAMRQNRDEWEERALKAEADIALTRPSSATKAEGE